MDDPSSDEKKATHMLDTSSLINRYVTEIDQLKSQLKEQREMVNATFENDASYNELLEKEKQYTKQKNAIKQNLLKQPAAATAVSKVKELREDVKDKQSALSGYLQEYQRLSGTNIIEGEDGEMREIVPVYRLVKRTSK